MGTAYFGVHGGGLLIKWEMPDNGLMVKFLAGATEITIYFEDLENWRAVRLGVPKHPEYSMSRDDNKGGNIKDPAEADRAAELIYNETKLRNIKAELAAAERLKASALGASTPMADDGPIPF